MKRFNVVAGRGLLGNHYSAGIDRLAAKIAKLPFVDFISVTSYTEWRAVRDMIQRWRDPTILGPAHSFSANAMTMIAEDLQGRVIFPLMLTVDPSPYWSWSLWQRGPSRVGNNVLKTVNMYQVNGLIGRQTLSGFNVTNIPVNSTHTDIDDEELVHDRALEEIKKLAA